MAVAHTVVVGVFLGLCMHECLHAFLRLRESIDVSLLLLRPLCGRLCVEGRCSKTIWAVQLSWVLAAPAGCLHKCSCTVSSSP